MLIVGLLKLFFLFASLADAAHVIPKNIRRLASRCDGFKKTFRAQSTEIPSVNVKLATALTLTGIACTACTGVGLYYYSENQALNRQLECRQLLLDEISKPDDYIKDVSKDPKFVKEAMERGHKSLCLQVLKCASFSDIEQIEFYDSKTGKNLLVQLIDQEESVVVLKLLENIDVPSNVLAAINQEDLKSGKTPFMAAFQSGNYELAGRMAYLGAMHPDPLELIKSVKQDRDDVAMQILRYFPSSSLHNIAIYNEETGQNLMVQMIEKGMGYKLECLLNDPNPPENFLAAIDQEDQKSGKTPLMAAYKARNFTLVDILLDLGAYDCIIEGTNPPMRVSKAVLICRPWRRRL